MYKTIHGLPIMQINRKCIESTMPDYLLGTLICISETSYMDSDIVSLNGKDVFTPKQAIKTDFYIKDSTSNDVVKVSIYEKLIYRKNNSSCQYVIELTRGISQREIANANKSCKCFGYKNSIVFEKSETKNSFYGYTIYIDGIQVGFVLPFGNSKTFERNTQGIFVMDYCNIKTAAVTISNYSNDPQEYHKQYQKYYFILHRHIENYIYEITSFSGLTVLGVSKDEKNILVRKNDLDYQGNEVFYDINKETLWITKVKITEDENDGTKLHTTASPFIQLGKARTFSKCHEYCGQSLEILKGFSIKSKNVLDTFYNMLSIGGEIRNYREYAASPLPK